MGKIQGAEINVSNQPQSFASTASRYCSTVVMAESRCAEFVYSLSRQLGSVVRGATRSGAVDQKERIALVFENSQQDWVTEVIMADEGQN